MIKNFYILLLLILFSIQETKISKLSSKNLRNLENDKPTVDFSLVENLATEGNNIKFDIILKQTPNLEERSYKITISINDGNKDARCTYANSSPQKLACTCDCGKPYYGFIELPLSSTVLANDDISLQITNKKTFQQTISLTYKNATMQFVNSGSGKYNIQIYLDGTIELQNNAELQLSLYSDPGYSLANCIYSSEPKMLNCQEVSGSNSKKIKFITDQKDGSIKWTNQKFEDDSVIMKLEAKTNIYGYDLDFVDNKWNFKIHMTNSDITFVGYYYYINIILINIDNNDSTLKALCYRKEPYKHECSIPQGTQAKNDLVFISSNQEGATVTFNNNIPAGNKLMIRLITLKFVNIYELTYSSKWIFKIDVEAEGEAAEIVREGLNVTVALYKNNHDYQTGSCLYSKINGKEILSCEEDHSKSDTDLFSLVPQKSVGSVTWSNIKTNTEKIKIPLELELTHVLSYYLAYEETETKWVFNIDANPSIRIPGKSFILIDIIYNTDGNTVAKCEAKSSNEIGAGAKTTFICECDLDENQSFQISQTKNMGSVSWKGLTGPITIKKRNEFKFIEAYNLELTYTSSVKKWSFEIKFEDINDLNPTSSIQYSLNIFYTLSPTDTKRSGSAKCSLKTGSSNIFSCESDFTTITIKDIIIYIGKATRTTADYIQWSEDLNDYYQITLKTELTFVKGTVSYNGRWSLNINVKDPKYESLPIGSKLKIDINEDSTSKAIECSVETNSLLKCDTDITSNALNSLPIFSISKTKTDLSSVTWKNTESDESFYILSLETTLSYKSANDMTFSTNKWQFSLDINEELKDKTKMIIDILYDGQPSTATCIKNTKILCIVDKDGQSKTILVKMNPTKTDKSTITWNNLSGNNEDIIAQKEIYVESVTSSYIEEKNKWEFKMKLQECDLPINSVVKVGLQKGGSPNTATCTLQSENMLICIPDVDTQESSDVFTIPSDSSIGSVTFKSGSTLTIRNAKTLGFLKADDLTINSANWEFKIKLTSSNLNDNDQINIDIKFNGNNDNAQCTYTHSTKTLLCTKTKITSGDRIIIINNINNQDLTWSNLNEYELYVSYSIKFINYYGDFYQNKWTFNLKYSENNIEANNNYALLDISVNGAAKTALCKIIPNYLSCISQHSEQNKNDVIKISSSTPISGTVTLTDVPATIEKIKPITIKIESPTVSGFGYSNNVISFKINGNLKDNEETEIGVNTITGVEIVVGSNDPIDAICLTNSINNSPVTLSCEASGTMDKAEDNVDIKVDSDGKSKYVTFDSINENISVYKKGQNSEESSNGEGDDTKTSEKSKNNNGFMMNINYFLFGLILLI